jgi:hypothetical protein
VGDLLAFFLIYRYCAEKARRARYDPKLDSLDAEIRVYGAFHIARICGFLTVDDRWGNKHRDVVDTLIDRLESSDTYLASYYEEATGVMRDVRKMSIEKSRNPTLYFKAGEAQKDIARQISQLRQSEANLDENGFLEEQNRT